jgi:hypothetical protein
MAAKVFLCYRRDDSAGYAGRVQDRLAKEFGRDLLFMDVDTIPLGVNFATVLRNEVAKCEVLLAVIGPRWLDARDEAGTRRLDDPQDFVRIEVGAALQRNIPVIPILLDGAKVPKANQLPKDLEELSMRNGLDVRHASFHNDIDRLVRSLKGQLSEADAEERRRDEDERRRQEAEVNQREDEEERRRKVEVSKFDYYSIGDEDLARLAAKDAWVPLVLSITYALWGGVAGMLVPRLGILKAVAIPSIPAFVIAMGLVAAWAPGQSNPPVVDGPDNRHRISCTVLFSQLVGILVAFIVGSKTSDAWRVSPLRNRDSLRVWCAAPTLRRSTRRQAALFEA